MNLILPQWLLEQACVPVDSAKQRLEDVQYNESPMDLLLSEFPELPELIKGKRVADFGSGWGWQAVAMAKDYGAWVAAIDSNPRSTATCLRRMADFGVTEDQVQPMLQAEPHHLGTFDVVISRNSMEHFLEPEKIMAIMASLLKPSGRLLITFGPPWYAPYGSHMRYFCPLPWVNLLFPESVVMRVRSRYRNDGATRYEEIESGLNRMTIRKFERIIANSGLRIERRTITPVSGMALLARLPVLRELFTNHLGVVLAKV